MALLAEFSLNESDRGFDPGWTIRCAWLQEPARKTRSQRANRTLKATSFRLRRTGDFHLAYTRVLPKFDVEGEIHQLVLIILLYFGMDLGLKVAIVHE